MRAWAVVMIVAGAGLFFTPDLGSTASGVATAPRVIDTHQIVGFATAVRPRKAVRILRFTAEPNALTSAGGEVALVVEVDGTGTCHFNSNRPRFAQSRSCSAGIRRVSVHVPANSTTSVQQFKFFVVAYSRAGSKERRSVSVVEQGLAVSPIGSIPSGSSSGTTSGSSSVGTSSGSSGTGSSSTAPTITQQPLSQSVQSGSIATFQAAASGSPTPSVQWAVSTDAGATWTAIGGATSTSYSFTTSPVQSGNEYEAVFTNIAGSASTSSAVLTVGSAPTITSSPTNETTQQGSTAMFEAQATGNPSPSIQWMLSTGGGSFNPVEGATSSCYSFEASSAANDDEIEAVFTNTYGSVTSSPATLTVASSIGWLSSNWSGFADIDPCAKFTSVSAEWSVPTVSCLSGSQYSSAWVGIDGFSDSSTVEQDGTESDCSSGKSSYYAWYEMYGDSAVYDGYEVELNPADYPVQPGDVIAASVQVSSDAWTLSLHDSTEAWSYATTIEFDGGSRSSAEWVLERPEICSSSCGVSSACRLRVCHLFNRPGDNQQRF